VSQNQLANVLGPAWQSMGYGALADRAQQLERAAGFARTLARYIADTDAGTAGEALARLQTRPVVAGRRRVDGCPSREGSSTAVDDYELIAEKLSVLSGQVSGLENQVSDVLSRMADVEKVNHRLEEAALTTARALAEIAGHWDAVYEAMRRTNPSEEPSH
jgi:hypothetical protein